MTDQPHWKTREYRSGDDGFVVSHWTISYLHSRRGYALGAQLVGSEANVAMLADEKLVVDWHLTHSDIDILCDVDNDNTLYGFCARTDDTVHYVCLKRSVAQHGLASDAVRALLGERMDKPCGFTCELVELVKLRLVPSQWYLDGTWFIREGRFIGGIAA